MRRHLVPIVLTALLTPACAGDGDAPETREDDRSVSGATLETMLLDGPVIRGFIIDGTGCATLGNPVIQGNSVTFTLVNYIATRRGAGLARATCDFGLEVQLPAGVTISLENAIYRGLVDGSAARSTFFREYFFGGVLIGDRRFTVIDYDVAGLPSVIRDDSDDYLSELGDFTASDAVLDVNAPPCGETAIWRTNTSLSVRNNASGSFSIAGFDSIEVENPYFATFEFGSPESCR